MKERKAVTIKAHVANRGYFTIGTEVQGKNCSYVKLIPPQKK